MTASTNTNPARAIPLYRSAGLIFGPSPTDKLIGDYRVARNYVAGYKAMYAQACAALGKANRGPAKYRSQAKSEAFRALNKVRAAMRKNYIAMDAAAAALLALGVEV